MKQYSNGFAKPTHRGSFVGQCHGILKKRVKTGRTIMVTMKDEDDEERRVRMPIRVSTETPSWVWNGTDWVTHTAYHKAIEAKAKRTPAMIERDLEIWKAKRREDKRMGRR